MTMTMLRVCRWQQIRFTPPREKTPPPPGTSEEFKSEQRIKLQSSGITPIAFGRPPSAQPPQSAPTTRPRRRAPPLGSTVTQRTPPSPEDAARARAQIGSEVLQWHARRSSRSISIDETSSAATSEPQSPTTTDQAEWLYQDAASSYDGVDPQDFDVMTSLASPPPQQQPQQQPSQTMTSSTVLVFKSPTAL